MKNFKIFIITIIIASITFLLGFDYNNNTEPHIYYQVYLDNKVLGTIKSKKQLEDYINKRGNYYKKKYNVKNVYAPNGLEIKKIATYDAKLKSVREIYKKIEKEKSFTIRGYKFVVKDTDDNKKSQIIYTTKESDFKNAIDSTIKTFVGTDKYESYLNGTQAKITTTGRLIENVYVDNDISIKQENISVNEKIFTEEGELTNFLLFGKNASKSKYIVQVGDTIEKVAFNNKISVEEFLISNPDFTNSNNLLFPGQEVTIEQTDPQIDVVVEEHVVQDIESAYKTEIKYDENQVIGSEQVVQNGVNGLERVTQKEKKINGNIVYVDPKSKEELTPSINKIIVQGDKYIPTVGSTTNWLWPTNSGWTISSGFGYRVFGGVREAHLAIDISGTGYGSPIYAVTNGVVSESRYRYPDGNYVCINHNNGYHTCYAHMARQAVSTGQTVERGQIIGYVGQSGLATGPHVHYEVWVGKPWYGGYRINPYSMY